MLILTTTQFGGAGGAEQGIVHRILNRGYSVCVVSVSVHRGTKRSDTYDNAFFLVAYLYGYMYVWLLMAALEYMRMIFYLSMYLF